MRARGRRGGGTEGERGGRGWEGREGRGGEGEPCGWRTKARKRNGHRRLPKAERLAANETKPRKAGGRAQRRRYGLLVCGCFCFSACPPRARRRSDRGRGRGLSDGRKSQIPNPKSQILNPECQVLRATVPRYVQQQQRATGLSRLHPEHARAPQIERPALSTWRTAVGGCPPKTAATNNRQRADDAPASESLSETRGVSRQSAGSH